MMQDFAMILLDVANNSLSAKADTITIVLKESAKEDRLTLSIEDNGCGMDEEALKRAADPFYTTRTTRRIGLGLAFFKGLAEQCGGSFALESKPNQGTRVAATVQRSHWDVPPLGDLAESLVALIQAKEDLTLSFHYQTDSASFLFHTDKIRAIIEDVPLNDPLILIWLKGYIQEHIEAVQREGGTYEITGRSQKNAGGSEETR